MKLLLGLLKSGDRDSLDGLGTYYPESKAVLGSCDSRLQGGEAGLSEERAGVGNMGHSLGNTIDLGDKAGLREDRGALDDMVDWVVDCVMDWVVDMVD